MSRREQLKTAEVERSNGNPIVVEMSPRLSFSRDMLFERSSALKEDTQPCESKHEDHSTEFEFSMAMKGCATAISCSPMLSPDQLFRNGEIVPLLAHPDLILRQHPSSEENQNINPFHIAENLQIALTKTSQASTCCAAESSASTVSASRGWKDILQKKKSSHQDYIVAECSDRQGRSRKSLYYRRSISAGEANALEASAQPMLERSKSDSRASWCGSIAVIPAAVSASPAGAITKGTEAFDRLVRKFNAAGFDDSPVADPNHKSPLRVRLPEASKSVLFDRSSSEGTSRFKGSDYPPPPYPIKKSVDSSPGSAGSRKPSFPRLDRELVRNGNRDYLRKAAVTNVDRIQNDLRKSCVAHELNQNGKIRSHARALRHYENRRNSEKVCVYQRNMQVTQVLHMNGCMGKSLLAPKVRFSECSSSDCSKKLTPNCKTIR